MRGLLLLPATYQQARDSLKKPSVFVLTTEPLYSAFGGMVTSSSLSDETLEQLQQSYSNGTLEYDYESAESFEAAINARANVTNAIVSFKVLRVAPNSIAGFNLFAGEHLNFISKDAKDISENEQATVIITKGIRIFGSWYIDYELIGTKDLDAINEAETSDEVP